MALPTKSSRKRRFNMKTDGTIDGNRRLRNSVIYGTNRQQKRPANLPASQIFRGIHQACRCWLLIFFQRFCY